MAANDIVDKLNRLIAEEGAFKHEKDVVYFMVQLRKLMERDNILSDHRSVKFYCDWVVHPKKSGNHTDVSDIYDAIYRECVDFYNEIYDEESSAIQQLLQFDSLRNDLGPLLQSYGINPAIAGNLWISFTKRLLCVLKDQPLEGPGLGIKEINIEEADGSEFALKITFTEPIRDTRGRDRTELKYGLGYLPRNPCRTEEAAV